jgi:hypothetical protein
MTIARARRITSLAMIAAVWGSLALLVVACTPAQQQRAVVDGQLFCAVATANGPLIVALADAAGAPIVVTGMTSQAVAAACAIIAAIPVIPPADPAAAPVVAVALGK